MGKWRKGYLCILGGMLFGIVVFSTACSSKKNVPIGISPMPVQSVLPKESASSCNEETIRDQFEKEYPSYSIVQIKVNKKQVTNTEIAAVVAYSDTKANQKTNVALFIDSEFYIIGLAVDDANFIYSSSNPVVKVENTYIVVQTYNLADRKTEKFTIKVESGSTNLNFEISSD